MLYISLEGEYRTIVALEDTAFRITTTLLTNVQNINTLLSSRIREAV